MTYAQIVDSGAVLEPVAGRLGLGEADLAGQISTNVNKATTIIDIAATGGDPAQLTRTANAVAAGAVDTLPTLELNPRGAPLYQVSQIRPADYPTVPSGPRPQRALAVGIIVGFCIGVGATMVLQKFDNRIHRPAELEALSRLPVLAVIPRPPRRWWWHRSPSPNPAIADGYRRVRAALLHDETRSSGEVLLCTPRHEGKAFALGLAKSFTDIGRRVLLVDADFDDEKAFSELGVARRPGLFELLSGGAAARTVLQDTPVPGLRVLAPGDPDPEHAGLADQRRLIRAVEALTAEFEEVVIQAPPVLDRRDATLLAGGARRYVVSVEAGRTRAPELAEALAVLRESPGVIVGAVMTGARSHDVPGRRDLVTSESSNSTDAPGSSWL